MGYGIGGVGGSSTLLFLILILLFFGMGPRVYNE